ncbi:hypothetical protein [Niastella populi]|uniref:Lipocalin-like domain-containing protein n=1 Tax=Niastella populi TaxID=550983 RepID=A0A1V9FJR0_9BACT|nr:hypothetical protein [Niastella populi]OQP58613.1 hypothetical protein A4R26_03940 [Niastella populi]
MYRPFKHPFLLLLLVSASFTACEKDKDDPEKEKSRTELLTEKVWVYVDQGRDDNGDGVLSKEESDLEECQLDDSFKYNTDGTLTDRDNTNRCSLVDPETEIFQWAFQNNETEIVTNGRLIKIKTLNETTLEGSSERLDGSSNTKIIAIFKHP